MKNKKTIIALIALIVCAAVLCAVYFAMRSKPVEGQKTITVQMQYDDVDREVEITTTEEYLSGALQQEKLIEGEDSAYGLYITTVDGRAADGSKNEFWGIYKDGTMTETGADGVVIADGDHYELVLGTW